MRRRIGQVLAVAAGLGLSVLGLSATGQVESSRPAPIVSPVRPVQLPYTAEFKITRVQTLADGSTLTRETTEVFARDSQGRWMSATTMASMAEDQTPRTNVNVNDPVARTHSFWLVPGQKATVTSMPDPATRAGCTAAVSPLLEAQPESQRIQPTVEQLGTQTIQGLEVRGSRVTHTYPPGSIGNSEQLVRTDETWFSTTPGLNGILVRQVNDDAQMGRTTREMVKFTQGEPDASVFQPPQDYEVVTQETHALVRCP